MNKDIVCDTPENINYFVLCAQRGALRLEIAGMKRRGQSALSALRAMGFKGNREQVLEKVNAAIEVKKKDLMTP